MPKALLKVFCSSGSNATSLHKRGHTAHTIKLKEKPSSSLLGPKSQDHSEKMEERRVAQPLTLFSQQKEIWQTLSTQHHKAKAASRGEKKDPWDYENKSTHCTQRKPGAQRTHSPTSICWRQEPTALHMQAFALVRLAILWSDNGKTDTLHPTVVQPPAQYTSMYFITPPLRGERGKRREWERSVSLK